MDHLLEHKFIGPIWNTAKGFLMIKSCQQLWHK